MRLFLLGVLLGLSACRSWGRPDEFKWEVVLETPKVSRGGDLVFRVETKGADGAPVKGIFFMYVIDWASVKGSRHKGASYEEQSQRVKGDRGAGELRIYARNETDNLIEVARATFQIE
jgi:hypothetical protein